jgi:hypothetical protein
MSAVSGSSFEAPHSAQTWSQKGYQVLFAHCEVTCQNNLQDMQIPPETVNELRHFSIIARMLVNLVNMAYLCLSSGFGSRCLLLGCFWHLKGLKYMYCTYKNMMLRSCIFKGGGETPMPKRRGLFASLTC